MAGSSLLLLLDDIALILDDVALNTKIAAQKTAGVLGDDLALNAQQVSGVKADRELPVVWAVAKGSFINKLILVPSALAISAFANWAILPLLMLGGAYLCYEGFEKLAHALLHKPEEDEAHHKEQVAAITNPAVDMVAFEKDKIKGAVRTDFILSAEIIVITLGTVAAATFAKQVAVLSIIAVLMTVGVYGLVAGIVKLDDMGLHLIKDIRNNGFAAIKRSLGRGLVAFAPYLMKFLSIAGTAAMFTVGGGILTHGVKAVDQWIEATATTIAGSFGTGLAASVVKVVTPMLINAVAGIIAGAIVLGLVLTIKRLIPKAKAA